MCYCYNYSVSKAVDTQKTQPGVYADRGDKCDCGSRTILFTVKRCRNHYSSLFVSCVSTIMYNAINRVTFNFLTICNVPTTRKSSEISVCQLYYTYVRGKHIIFIVKENISRVIILILVRVVLLLLL